MKQKQTMALQKVQLISALNDKMFSEMRELQKKLGLRHFAGQIGTSAATLSRLMKGGEVDLSTLELLCKWLKKPIGDFVK